MKTILVVNGEADWQHYFPGYEVRQCHLQTSKWLYHNDQLWVFDGSERLRIEGILWRVGAIRPHPHHRTVLELIRLAGISCVNSVSALLRGFDRLSMLNELRTVGLPIPKFSVALGDNILDAIHPDLPAVVKIGNYHGGFGKALAHDEAGWSDVKDMAFTADEYVTVEPYLDYVRDIRCLAIGESVWAMARRGTFWKANTQTVDHEIIAVSDELREHTAHAMRHLGADILGRDFLEMPDGRYVLLESNDVPGLSGFPADARVALARRLREKLES